MCKKCSLDRDENTFITGPSVEISRSFINYENISLRKNEIVLFTMGWSGSFILEFTYRVYEEWPVV